MRTLKPNFTGGSCVMDGQINSHIDDSLLLDEALEAPPIVGFDERRMHVRAYNYWASLLGDRRLPSIEDLNPAEIEDFGSHSVLLDFTSGIDDPAIAFLGSTLAAQCDVTGLIDRVSQVPARTLLSRLTDHYLEIIANAAPISFEAEFTNQRGNDILYRGIMMPFSSDDDTIDFVYGVINWKEVASDTLRETIAAQVEADLSRHDPSPPVTAESVWDTRAITMDGDEDGEEEDDALDLTSAHMIDSPPATLSLDDSLAAAREAAAAAITSESRTRHALYRAIGLAHGFALVAVSRPEDYAALLAEAGIESQPRSPTTALAKLIFGATYDKTRIAEFVCAIDYALEAELAPGALVEQLHARPGGLKALVADMRAKKRGEAPPAAPKPASRARRRLARAHAIALDSLAMDESGLAVVVLRREADGSIVPVATLAADDRLADRVISAAAKAL
jgi:hypothetical protein